MAELVVLVPVLNRPHRVRPLLGSLEPTVPAGTRVMFIVDSDDLAEQDSIRAARGSFEDRLQISLLKHDGGYAAKIRAGVKMTVESLLFLAADDLTFEDGWFEAAAAYMRDTKVEVVGVNDMVDRQNHPNFRDRVHATQFLMTRAYASRPVIDGTPGPLASAYHHWYIDDELIATATKRGTYAYAEDSHVRHDHPLNGQAPDDDTYRFGRSRARDDRRIFLGRRALWT